MSLNQEQQMLSGQMWFNMLMQTSSGESHTPAKCHQALHSNFHRLAMTGKCV